MYMWSDEEKTRIIAVSDSGNVREVLEGTVEYEQALQAPPEDNRPIDWPKPTDEELAQAARAQRNALLAASDWTQLPDIPEDIRLAWQPYRQALRDLPDQEGFPATIDWPTPPGA